MQIDLTTTHTIESPDNDIHVDSLHLPINSLEITDLVDSLSTFESMVGHVAKPDNVHMAINKDDNSNHTETLGYQPHPS